MKKLMLCFVILSLLTLISACKQQSTTKEVELPVKDISKLVINNRNGEVEITGHSNSEKIEVTALVKANGISMDKLKFSLKERKNIAYLDATFDGQFFAMGSGSVDLHIKIPKHLQLDMNTHRDGNISISDLSSNIEIVNVNGDINVSNSEGPVLIENRDGDMEIRDIASKVTLNNKNGKIQAMNIDGPIDINNRDGNLSLHNIDSDVKIMNLNGHIKVDEIDGSAKIHVGDGSLDINYVSKNVEITQTGNGKVNINNIKGNITRNKK
ncbi:hypothetical protein QNH20_01245 [Neobacillus sp. WH10]|uniref:DUF4097 family beta strand repeat-containing protein n=1 Tax=Neobacillus sp. WH10 TaxID=3047873 RepID=UPI0024C1E041|nr:DUF4097 family beta strand repeat-containing protein [Neobacillus sp. WH10]WHY77834.1 hypothetical protein QNH20_01245 [Neobacillus sp. WH10]